MLMFMLVMLRMMLMRRSLFFVGLVLVAGCVHRTAAGPPPTGRELAEAQLEARVNGAEGPREGDFAPGLDRPEQAPENAYRARSFYLQGVKLSTGLDGGHQIGLILSQLALPYGALESFDDLPIAFRCVATDIRQGKTVVLHDGSFAQALRATMAIPVALAPVLRNGRVPLHAS